MLTRLSKPTSLLATFAATVIITFIFPVFADLFDISFVDALSDPDQTREAIAAMSAEQRTQHAWVTATLDVIYPLAYGAFFAGAAAAAFPRFRIAFR